jgi:hypothetical protein
MRDRTNEKSSAHQKLSTVNPGTIVVVSIIRRAFNINVNKPNVMIFTGRVRIKRIGFKNTLMTPSTTATINAVTKLSI